jgi:hypothetical protein
MPKRPPQLMHWSLRPSFPRRLAGQATKRTPSWWNTAGASDGTTQTAGRPWRTKAAAALREFSGGIDHQPLGGCLPHSGLILWAHREVGERPGCPQMPGGPSQLQQQGLIDAQRIGRIGPLITGHAMAEQDPGRQRLHLLDEGRRR